MVTIYFITDGTNIKIGRTSNIEKRIKNLQTSNSNDLKVIYCIYNVEKSFEKLVHGICERYHINKEWFSMEAVNHLLKLTWFKDNMVPYNGTILTLENTQGS
jgi:hypothetical protein